MNGDESLADQRAAVDQENRDRLISLMALHGLFIPYRDFDKWRPTVETTGEVDGFWHMGTLKCIATDGLQAWFLTVDGRPWIGHVGNFHWDEPKVSYVPYINEYGEEKFFKSVKDRGAPPAYIGLPKKTRVKSPKVKKQRLSPAEKLLVRLQQQIQARTAPGV